MKGNNFSLGIDKLQNQQKEIITKKIHAILYSINNKKITFVRPININDKRILEVRIDENGLCTRYEIVNDYFHAIVDNICHLSLTELCAILDGIKSIESLYFYKLICISEAVNIKKYKDDGVFEQSKTYNSKDECYEEMLNNVYRLISAEKKQNGTNWLVIKMNDNGIILENRNDTLSYEFEIFKTI